MPAAAPARRPRPPARGRLWAEVFRQQLPQVDFRIWPDVGDAAQVRFIAGAFDERLVQGRGREVHPLMYLVSLAFLAYFGMGLIQGWTH